MHSFLLYVFFYVRLDHLGDQIGYVKVGVGVALLATMFSLKLTSPRCEVECVFSCTICQRTQKCVFYGPSIFMIQAPYSVTNLRYFPGSLLGV